MTIQMRARAGLARNPDVETPIHAHRQRLVEFRYPSDGEVPVPGQLREDEHAKKVLVAEGDAWGFAACGAQPDGYVATSEPFDPLGLDVCQDCAEAVSGG